MTALYYLMRMALYMEMMKSDCELNEDLTAPKKDGLHRLLGQ